MQTKEIILDDFEKAIEKELRNLNRIKLGEQSNEWWTNSVKNKVAIAVRNKNKICKIYASGCNEGLTDGPEWLYDLTCRIEENDYIKNILLVLESEWKNSKNKCYKENIRYDFEKLLVSRSKYRVIVLEANNDKEKEDIVGQLRKCIEQFQDSNIGDRYLFACWKQNKNERKFDFSVYVVS